MAKANILHSHVLTRSPIQAENQEDEDRDSSSFFLLTRYSYSSLEEGHFIKFVWNCHRNLYSQFHDPDRLLLLVDVSQESSVGVIENCGLPE